MLISYFFSSYLTFIYYILNIKVLIYTYDIEYMFHEVGGI